MKLRKNEEQDTPIQLDWDHIACGRNQEAAREELMRENWIHLRGCQGLETY